MTENKPIRIDKFLWAVRLFKTRSIASDECRKGRISINGIQIKPSRLVVADEVIQVKKPPVTYSYRIIEPIGNRVSAKIAGQFIEDLTPADEMAKSDIARSGVVVRRARGTGRPTKKERRIIDKFQKKSDE